ncbi:GerAB/ArcD/ProY family transporter [Chungangia koreensis]|uniref:GerAB/ArcD/ProY family transporter n=1 Tax=Chungangia koreensis TaxID=752657 RepID=A0ABV8X5T5_9LACT
MKIILSRIQFFLLVFIIQTGVVFITFQSSIINYGGRDAWLIFILASILFYIQLLLYEKGYHYFHLGRILSWMYEIYWLIVNIGIIVTVDYILAIWAFPNTPHFIIIALMVLVSFYANMGRPETVLNLGAIFIPLIALFVLFLLLAYDDLVWTNILPLGTSTLKQWGEGLLYAQIVFLGSEVYLIYRKYVNASDERMKKPLFWYWFTVTVFLLGSILIVLLYFSMAEIKIIQEPLLYVLKSQEVTFLERLDLFFLYIWIIWSIVTFTMLSFTKILVHRHNNKRHKRVYTIVCHLLLIIIPSFLIRLEVMNILRYVIIPLYILFSMIIPFFVILIGWRKRQK